MAQWEIVIGLETHTQLTTASKIFSGSSTAFGAAPNTQASVVDLALPGALPVMNKGAVERAVKFGLAIGAKINQRSIFARKNYFYPDLPKGYQISQFETPIVQGGGLTITLDDGTTKFIELTRAHLEEDAGKSVHNEFDGASGVDLNRAGTPLLEIVTEPVMRSGKEAIAYAKALHNLVRYLDICDGNMQEGSFRCDVNVSVRPAGQKEFGTRREIKNLNSFKFMQQAIDYEVRWQIEQIEDGNKIVQATVLFNPDTGETRAMRSKEDAMDYRYFPDPDLPPLVVSDEMLSRIKASMPELPQAKCARFSSEYLLSHYDALLLSQDGATASFFETAVKAGADAKLVANWMLGELVSCAQSRRQNDSSSRRSMPCACRIWSRASATARSTTRLQRPCSRRYGVAKRRAWMPSLKPKASSRSATAAPSKKSSTKCSRRAPRKSPISNPAKKKRS